MTYKINPFPKGDMDRHSIWDMLVTKDIDAYLTQDWDGHAEAFHTEGFFGIHCNFRANPDSWRLAYTDISGYRDEWLRQAHATAADEFDEDLRDALFRATNLRDIDVQGNFAIAHKKFDGVVKRRNRPDLELFWQSINHLRRIDGKWKVVSFTGYLPGNRMT